MMENHHVTQSRWNKISRLITSGSRARVCIEERRKTTTKLVCDSDEPFLNCARLTCAITQTFKKIKILFFFG